MGGSIINIHKGVFYKLAGFFGTVKAINKCTDELLVVGKDYALRFKGGEITAQDYESEMVGKIYELSNKYAGGDDDLEKYLKQHFADPSVKFLKRGNSAIHRFYATASTG